MARSALWGRLVAGAGATLLGGCALAACSSSGTPSSTVLLVGSYHGHTGQYDSIQAAVNAAQPGNWVLSAPGDYHEADDANLTSKSALSTGDHGGVVVHTSD